MGDKNIDAIKAFPSTVQYFPEDTNYHEQQGMTLRDYFAAKVMPELLAAALHPEFSKDKCLHIINKIAESSYDMADAMLKERDK